MSSTGVVHLTSSGSNKHHETLGLLSALLSNYCDPVFVGRASSYVGV